MGQVQLSALQVCSNTLWYLEKLTSHVCSLSSVLICPQNLYPLVHGGFKVGFLMVNNVVCGIFFPALFIQLFLSDPNKI